MQEEGQVVWFNFKMMDSKGTLIESSMDEPISIISGKNHIFKPVENAVVKMSEGDTKRIPVRSNEAFGDYNEDLVYQIPTSKFENVPKVGDSFEMEIEDGTVINMNMVDEKNGVCILDGNHTLAGVDLLFEIEVVKRRLANAQEIKTGKVSTK